MLGKKVEECMNIMREVEVIKKTQIKLLKMKNTVAEKKTLLYWINSKLDTKEKEISEL